MNYDIVLGGITLGMFIWIWGYNVGCKDTEEKVLAERKRIIENKQ